MAKNVETALTIPVWTLLSRYEHEGYYYSALCVAQTNVLSIVPPIVSPACRRSTLHSICPIFERRGLWS